MVEFDGVEISRSDLMDEIVDKLFDDIIDDEDSTLKVSRLESNGLVKYVYTLVRDNDENSVDEVVSEVNLTSDSMKSDNVFEMLSAVLELDDQNKSLKIDLRVKSDGDDDLDLKIRSISVVDGYKSPMKIDEISTSDDKLYLTVVVSVGYFVNTLENLEIIDFDDTDVDEYDDDYDYGYDYEKSESSTGMSLVRKWTKRNFDKMRRNIKNRNKKNTVEYRKANLARSKKMKLNWKKNRAKRMKSIRKFYNSARGKGIAKARGLMNKLNK